MRASKAMSAPNGPSLSSSPNPEPAAQEPSMDDILASIRRIIADDDALPLSRAARAAAAPRLAEAPAPAKPAPAAPAPAKPASSVADAFLGLGERLFRSGEAAPTQERPTVSVFQPPAQRAASPLSSQSSEPQKAPTLKLRDFAPLEPQARPVAGKVRTADSVPAPKSVQAPQAVAAPQPAPAPQIVQAPEVLQATPALKSAVAAVAAEPAKKQALVLAPEPVIEASEAPAAPVSTISNLAEARLKAAPPPPRPPAAPQAEAVPELAPAAEPAPAPVAAESSESPAPRLAARRIPAPSPAASESEPPLLSPAIGARIGASFEALAESLLLRDPDMIERVAREMLRPMLKSWLDDNLPVVVERLVRAEIERIARGRG
jgi:cell pole-organizing protein PopZ